MARAAAAAPSLAPLPGPTPTIDFDHIGFGLDNVGSRMFVATWREGADGQGAWSEGELRPYGPLEIMPSAQVLNYGQALFEGLKAQRTADGHVVLFRPDANAGRMQDGARRMHMAEVPLELFERGVIEAVRANGELVPPHGKGALYIRPLLIGSGPILGVAPSKEYTFLVFVAAVGAYFKGGQLSPIELRVETSIHRAAPRGTGATKAAGNYSPGLVTLADAKKHGFADVVYLDAKHDTYLEEVSSCNVFVLTKDNVIKTPPLAGSILPGVTRRSIVQLAKDLGYEVREEPISVQEALEAKEMFTSGTAVVVASVNSLTYKGKRTVYGVDGEYGEVAKKLYHQLVGVQTGELEDTHGWVRVIG